MPATSRKRSHRVSLGAPGCGQCHDVDLVGGQRGGPAGDDPAGVLLTPEPLATLAVGADRLEVLLPGPRLAVLDDLLPHGGHGAAEVPYTDHDAKVGGVEGVGEQRDLRRPQHGEELHRDHRGPGMVVDLLDQRVPGARLTVARLHEVRDGVDLAAPGGSGEEHALLAEELAVGVEPTLQERRTGLHQADVDHHALGHGSPRLVVSVADGGQSASRARRAPGRTSHIRFPAVDPHGHTDVTPSPSTGRTRLAMGRLCETDGLTDDQTEILKAVRSFVERRDPAGRHRARARRRVPHRDRRGPQGARHLRADDPRGVRRPRRVAADLRAGRRGDRARLDERQRDHQHPLHRGLHADAARHRGAEAEVPAADGDRRGPRRLLDERAGLRLRRRRDHDQGPVARTRPTRTDLRDHRPEDVADQRRLGQPGRRPGARPTRAPTRSTGT